MSIKIAQLIELIKTKKLQMAAKSQALAISDQTQLQKRVSEPDQKKRM
jgi:hypothetical protein